MKCDKCNGETELVDKLKRIHKCKNCWKLVYEASKSQGDSHGEDTMQ